MPEERQAHMKNEHDAASAYTEGSLPERFDSWVSHTLENLINNVVRSYARKVKNAREVSVEDMDERAFFDPYSEEELNEILLGKTPVLIRNKKLAKGLEKLSPRKQQIIEGTIVLGIPIELLAEMLGLDNGTVRNYKYDGLRILREFMEDEEYE